MNQYINLLYFFVTFNNIIPDFFILPILVVYILLRKVVFNVDSVMIIIAILLTMFLNMIFNYEYFNILLYLHLLFVVISTILIKDKFFDLLKFIKCVKVVTLLNFMLIFTFVIPNLRGYFFYENLGFYRYKSVYLEPSILASFTVFNMLVIMFYDRSNKKMLFTFSNLIVLFLSFSGSGFFIFMFIFFIYSIIKLSLRYIICLLSFLLLFFVYILNFENAFTIRVYNFLNNNYDNSTILRFVAPVEYLIKFSEKNFYNIFIGVGDPRMFIKKNFYDFNFFYLWNQLPTYNVNNGYIVALSLGGIVFILILLVYLISKISKHKIPILIFIIIFPLFSGHFVSILYWFLLSVFSLEFYKRNKVEGIYEKSCYN